MDRQWRVLQIAILEHCAEKRDLDAITATVSQTSAN
jgi:hypothetical protein